MMWRWKSRCPSARLPGMIGCSLLRSPQLWRRNTKSISASSQRLLPERITSHLDRETTPPSAALLTAIRPEKRGVAGTAGVSLLTALAPLELYRGGAGLQCMRSGATPLCRSCHGASYSQWHRPVAAPRPDTRPEMPLAGPSSRRPRAGTPRRRPASVRAGWLRLHLRHTRTQNPYCSGVPSATIAPGLGGGGQALPRTSARGNMTRPALACCDCYSSPGPAQARPGDALRPSRWQADRHAPGRSYQATLVSRWRQPRRRSPDRGDWTECPAHAVLPGTSALSFLHRRGSLPTRQGAVPELVWRQMLPSAQGAGLRCRASA